MDEILIDDKKYVSSKRAAKITGYAKDYIGQLCREGRVPARLVGRSWYVLETAIQDHRFNTKEDIKPEVIKPAKTSIPAFSQTWESPRYEASLEEPLPVINRLRDDQSVPPDPVEPVENENKNASQYLQDSWKEWFNHVADSEPVVEQEEKPEIQEKTEEDRGEVNVPVHAVYEHEELPPENLLPRPFTPIKPIHIEVPPIIDDEEGRAVSRGGGKGFVRTIQIVGIVLAVIAASLASIGSGYLDRYIISNSRAGIISGVLLYNK